MYYVYVMVERESGKRYIGYSNDLKKRVEQHRNGTGAKYTKPGDWMLAYYEAFADNRDAVERERKLKHDGRARYQLMKRLEKSLAWSRISAGEAHDRSTRKRRP